MVRIVDGDRKDAERNLGSGEFLQSGAEAGQRRLAIRDLRHVIQRNVPQEVGAAHLGGPERTLLEAFRGADDDTKLVSNRNRPHAHRNPLPLLVAQENTGKATRSQIRSASLTLRRRTWPSTRTTISPRKSIYNYALSSTTSLTTPISPTSTPIRWTPPSGRRCHSSFRVGGRWEPKSCFRRPSPRFCYAQQSWAEFACLPPLVTFVSRRSAADLGLCHNGSASCMWCSIGTPRRG